MRVANTIKDKLARIERAEGELLKFFAGKIKAGVDIYIADFILIASLKRTLALSAGFRSLIEVRNFTSAAALLRLQLDTALRLHAATLYSHPEEYAKAVFDGKPVDKLKSRDGNRLTDSYLAKTLSEKHPWVEQVYKDLCDFVHFSNRHFFTSIGKVDEREHTVHMLISAQDPPKPDEAYFEVLDTYYDVMKLTGTLAGGWLLAKENNYGMMPSSG
jgi:hypothetical protein